MVRSESSSLQQGLPIAATRREAPCDGLVVRAQLDVYDGCDADWRRSLGGPIQFSAHSPIEAHFWVLGSTSSPALDWSLVGDGRRARFVSVASAADDERLWIREKFAPPFDASDAALELQTPLCDGWLAWSAPSLSVVGADDCRRTSRRDDAGLFVLTISSSAGSNQRLHAAAMVDPGDAQTVSPWLTFLAMQRRRVYRRVRHFWMDPSGGRGRLRVQISHRVFDFSPSNDALASPSGLLDEACSIGDADVVMQHRCQPVRTVRLEPFAARGAAIDSAMAGRSGFVVQRRRRYAATFRAQADARRSMRVACRQSRPPFANLGADAHRTFHLTSKLQRYRFEFVASSDDDDAKLYFELGGSDVGVEISDVHLMEVADGDEFD